MKWDEQADMGSVWSFLVLLRFDQVSHHSKSIEVWLSVGLDGISGACLGL